MVSVNSAQGELSREIQALAVASLCLAWPALCWRSGGEEAVWTTRLLNKRDALVSEKSSHVTGPGSLPSLPSVLTALQAAPGGVSPDLSFQRRRVGPEFCNQGLTPAGARRRPSLLSKMLAFNEGTLGPCQEASGSTAITTVLCMRSGRLTYYVLQVPA